MHSGLTGSPVLKWDIDKYQAELKLLGPASGLGLDDGGQTNLRHLTFICDYLSIPSLTELLWLSRELRSVTLALPMSGCKTAPKPRIKNLLAPVAPSIRNLAVASALLLDLNDLSSFTRLEYLEVTKDAILDVSTVKQGFMSLCPPSLQTLTVRDISLDLYDVVGDGDDEDDRQVLMPDWFSDMAIRNLAQHAHKLPGSVVLSFRIRDEYAWSKIPDVILLQRLQEPLFILRAARWEKLEDGKPRGPFETQFCSDETFRSRKRRQTFLAAEDSREASVESS